MTVTAQPPLVHEPAPAPATRSRLPLVIASAAALVGCVTRVVLLGSSVGDLDSDEAIVGLMARRLLDGQFDVFFTDQAYGGSQEAWVAGAVFAVTGSSVVALKLVMVAFTAATAVLTWRVGRRIVDENAAVIAAALVWIGPPFAVWWSTKARGFYGMSSTMVLVAILAALRLVDRPSRRDAVVLGLAIGLGWWASPQTAAVAGPAVLWAIVVRPRMLRLAPFAVAAALIGAAPWIVFNLRNDFSSFDTPAIVGDATFAERLRSLFTEAAPRFFGASEYFSGDWHFGAVGALVLAGCGVGLVVWSVLAIRARYARIALVGPLVVFPVYFGVNPFTTSPEARYVWVIAPILVLVAGDALVRLATRIGRAQLAYAAVPLAAAMTIVGLVDFVDRANVRPGYWDVVSGDARPLADALAERGYSHAYADYWVAYKISFESEERVIATGVQRPRGLPDHYAVAADPRPAYVTFAASPDAERVRSRFATLDIPIDQLQIGLWVAYLPLADVPADVGSTIYTP